MEQKRKSDRGLDDRGEVVQVIAALAIVLLGVSVIVGWHIGSVTLVRVSDPFVSMAYNAALEFVLCGIVWLCQIFDKRRFAIIVSALVLVLGLLTLLEYVTGISLGIDELLMTHVIKGERLLQGRMAPNTALNFVLIGLALLIYSRGVIDTKRAAIVGILGAVVSALAAVAFIGYLANLPTAYGWGRFSAMAAHTSVGFIILGASTIVRAWREDTSAKESTPRWAATLACIGMVTVTICLWQALSAQRLETTQQAVNSRAQNLQHEIEFALRERVLALQRMGDRWAVYGDEGTPYSQWQADAQNYIRDFTGFQAIEWVDPNFHVQWVEPFPGNEAAINMNLAGEERRRTAFEAARDSRASSFTRTVKLVQGGDGLLLIVSIYRQDVCKGYLLGVFPVSGMFDAILSQDTGDDFAITVSDGERDVYRRGLVGQQARWSDERAVNLNGVNWHIRITPQPRLAVALKSHVPEVALITGLLVSILLGWTVFLAQAAKERARESAKLNGELGREVTERVQTEVRLRRSEERYRALVDNSLGLICTHDMEGRLLSINPAAARALGYQADELEGRKIHDVIAQSSRAEMSLYLKHASESQTMSGLMQVVTRAGEARVWAYNNQYCENPGNTPYILGYAQDVTDLKRVQNDLVYASSQLREMTTLQQAILNSTNYTIISTSVDGTIRTFNRAAQTMLGYSPEEVIGKHTPAIIHDPLEVAERAMELTSELGREIEPGFEAFAAKARMGVVDENEWTYIRKDGSRFPVMLSATALHDATGQITGFLGIASDTTERKRMEEELQRAHDAALESTRLKSEFLANMSHEIRTPMNGVIGMTGLLLDTGLDAQQSEYAETIRSSADSLLTIINDILDFSKIEAGMMKFEMLDFQLRNAVENTIEMFAERAAAKGLEVGSIFQSDLPRVLHGDPGRLRQILTNLIGNAIKFTSHGSVLVHVTTERETDTHVLIRFAVRDTGIGILREAQDELFTPFMQADSSTTRKYGGTGLGLAISKQIIELMNGQIGVDSAPSEGSTFWFTAEFEKSKAQTMDDASATVQLQGLRLLIVDDSPVNRRVLTNQIASWGIAHAVSEDWAHALRALKDAARQGTSFDVAIIDMQLARPDAFEFARQLKADPNLTAVKVVLMTAYGQRGDAQEARASGVAAYLTKPTRQSHLFDCLVTITNQNFNELAGDLSTPAGLVTKHSLEEERHTFGRRGRILVAEDNPVNQKVILHQLKNLGYRADAVGNGREVLTALASIPYALVLMDCHMPEMDGVEATTEIRSREGSNHHTPIIAVTANAMRGEREKYLQSGMDDYLSKPFTAAELDFVVRKWIAPTKTKQTDIPEPEKDKPAIEPVYETFSSERMEKMRSDFGDEMVAELIEIFLDDTAERMVQISGAAAERDALKLGRAAHGLKGSCRNLGALHMAWQCEQLEVQTRVAITDETLALCSNLESEWSVVRPIIEAERTTQQPA